MIKKFLITGFAIAAIGITSQAQDKRDLPPPPPPKQALVKGDKDYEDFLKRNPAVKSLHWKGSGRIMGVRLKSGKEEVYNLDNETELAIAEKKYGSLPEAPPPPPPIPAKPTAPNEIVDKLAPPSDAGTPGDYLPTPPKKQLPPPPPPKKAGRE